MKNIVISILASVLIIVKVPWFSVCTASEKTGILIGVAIPLIIFCFFCDFLVEKWRKYRKRVEAVRRKVEKLRNERREIA